MFFPFLFVFTGGSKTLMFLEDCPKSEFGCSVLLRGGNQFELSRVKRVMRHMIFCQYNWRLELSYLMDEFACPPNTASDTFFEDSSYKQSESNVTKHVSGCNHSSVAHLYPGKTNSADSESKQIAVKQVNSVDNGTPLASHQDCALANQNILFCCLKCPPENQIESKKISSNHQNNPLQCSAPKSRRRSSNSDQTDATRRVTAESISDFS